MPDDLSRHWYVYAILSADTDTTFTQALTGLGDAAVSLVRSGAVAAAVSPFTHATVEPSSAQLLRHEATVEAIRRAAPALPVRFGTIFPDIAALVHALAARAPDLQADLARVGDKLEMGLSILWAASGTGTTPGDTPSHAEGEDSMAALPASLQGPSGPGAQYLASRFTHYASESRGAADARRIAQRIDAALRPYVIESRYALRPAPRLALRSVHLLQPDGEAAFRRACEDLRKGAPDLHVLVTGPWPPYSFATPPRQSRTAQDLPIASAVGEPGRADIDAIDEIDARGG